MSEVQVLTEEAIDACWRVRHVASTDTARPVLASVHVEPGRVWATDSYRLMVVTDVDCDATVSIPTDRLAELPADGDALVMAAEPGTRAPKRALLFGVPTPAPPAIDPLIDRSSRRHVACKVHTWRLPLNRFKPAEIRRRELQIDLRPTGTKSLRCEWWQTEPTANWVSGSHVPAVDVDPLWPTLRLNPLYLASLLPADRLVTLYASSPVHQLLVEYDDVVAALMPVMLL